MDEPLDCVGLSEPEVVVEIEDQIAATPNRKPPDAALEREIRPRGGNNLRADLRGDAGDGWRSALSVDDDD